MRTTNRTKRVHRFPHTVCAIEEIDGLDKTRKKVLDFEEILMIIVIITIKNNKE